MNQKYPVIVRISRRAKPGRGRMAQSQTQVFQGRLTNTVDNLGNAHCSKRLPRCNPALTDKGIAKGMATFKEVTVKGFPLP